MNVSEIRNPIWLNADNHRDPAVMRVPGGYRLFYTRHSNASAGQPGAWGREENWSVASVFTPDFRSFREDRDISGKGFASPGDPTRWHGRLILPFQSYPAKPNRLCFALSADEGRSWSEPAFFLDEARELPWNPDRRLIDPSFVLDRETLHCYFVGSAGQLDRSRSRENYLGHAVTRDPDLRRWQIVSRDAPLIGTSEFAPDGVENVIVIRVRDGWTMIYSEGLREQHLAYATSPDLYTWTRAGRIDLPVQWWMHFRHGAPFVWREDDRWLMVLMGEENAAHRAYLGLLYSDDAIHWTLCPEDRRGGA